MQSANDSYVFTFDSKPIRMLLVNGEPWLCGKDIASVLEYKNVRDAMAKHVDNEDKMRYVDLYGPVANRDTPIEQPHMIYINESGLYSLVLRSRMPTAKQFKRWVTSEVLPSIRRNGYYVDPNIQDEKMQMLVEEYKSRMEAAENKLEAAEQKLEVAEKKVVKLSSFVTNIQALEKKQVIYIATCRSLAAQNRFKFGGVQSMQQLATRLTNYNTGHAADDPFYICKYIMCNNFRLIESHIHHILSVFHDKKDSKKEMLHIRYNLLCDTIDLIVENADKEVDYINERCQSMIESTINDEPIIPEPVDNLSITVTKKTRKKKYDVDVSEWSDEQLDELINRLIEQLNGRLTVNWMYDVKPMIEKHGPLTTIKNRFKEYLLDKFPSVKLVWANKQLALTE
jgi:prophage antirepressor-like protein